MVKGSSPKVEFTVMFCTYIKCQVIAQHLPLQNLVLKYVCMHFILLLSIIGSDAIDSVLSACTMHDIICTILGLHM